MTLINAMSSEHDEQAALFSWAEWQGNNTPELHAMYAIPNGQYRPGERPEPGIRSGVPDICLPVARGGYFSLYIELKHDKNKTSKNQDEWIAKLRMYGHCVKVCYGFEEAKNEIMWYLNSAPTPLRLPF